MAVERVLKPVFGGKNERGPVHWFRQGNSHIREVTNAIAISEPPAVIGGPEENNGRTEHRRPEPHEPVGQPGEPPAEVHGTECTERGDVSAEESGHVPEEPLALVVLALVELVQVGDHHAHANGAEHQEQ